MRRVLSFAVALLTAYYSQADETYIVDDTNPSVIYAGQWHREDDYGSSYNSTLSNALEQNEDTTASINFYGTVITVYGDVRTNTNELTWGANATAEFWLDGTEVLFNGTRGATTPPRRRFVDPQYYRRQQSSTLSPEATLSDWFLYQSDPLPLANHTLLISNIGAYVYLDCFFINSTKYPVSGTPPSSTSSSNPSPTNSQMNTTRSPASPSGSSTTTFPPSASRTQDTPSSTGAASLGKRSVGAIIGGIVAAVVALLLLAVLLIWRRRYKGENPHTPPFDYSGDASFGEPIAGSTPRDYGESMAQWRAGSDVVTASQPTIVNVPSEARTILPYNVIDHSMQEATEEPHVEARPFSEDGRDLAPSEYQTVISSLPPPYTAL